MRGRLDESRYQRRGTRYQTFYGSSYNRYWSRPATYYDDGYASSFWWWLRDQNYETQAYYAYNHRYDMDARRYNDLMGIAGVASAVGYLEATHTARNQYWSPSGMDYDLMYNDDYVNNVYHYNSSPPTQNVVYQGGNNNGGSGSGFVVFVVIFVVVIVVLLGFTLAIFRN
jgi:hypothetical protein